MDNTKRMLDEFFELVSIPVQSRDERAICDALKSKLAGLGLEVYEDDAAEKLGGNAGNIVALLKGEDGVAPLLFSAHQDRVRNNGRIHPVVDENQKCIKSDGTSILAADDVSGLCAILDALRTIVEEKIPHGDIEVVFSVCEEVGVRGAGQLAFSKLRSKRAYIFDCPGRLGRIINQAPTKCNIVATVKGIKAHAGNEPEKGLNAIKVAAKALVDMPEGRISPKVTANFGMIRGGSGTNVVCDEVVITGEARGTDDAALEKYLVRVREVFAQTARLFNTTIDVKIDPLYHTYHVDENAKVVHDLKKALKEEGVDGFCESAGGGSDGNHFNHHGIDAVVTALGYSKNHTNAEQIYYEDMTAASRVIVNLVRNAYFEAKKE